MSIINILYNSLHLTLPTWVKYDVLRETFRTLHALGHEEVSESQVIDIKTLGTVGETILSHVLSSEESREAAQAISNHWNKVCTGTKSHIIFEPHGLMRVPIKTKRRNSFLLRSSLS